MGRAGLESTEISNITLEEFFRIGILIYGVKTSSPDSNVDLTIPRIELSVGQGLRQTTVRLNNQSPFTFEGNSLACIVNNEEKEVPAMLFQRWIGSERYTFSPIRENGPSLVFDWVHDYCSNKCKFCFKEYDWTIIQNQGNLSRTPLDEKVNSNLDEIDRHLSSHSIDILRYPFVWLCTGTLADPKKERAQHLRVLNSIVSTGYAGKVFMSIAPPRDIVFDKNEAVSLFRKFKSSGLSRINSGMELVSSEARKRYIVGFKGTLTCEDYCHFLGWATDIFGKEVGSCVLIGLEPHENSLTGMEELAKRGIQSIPTIYTSFTAPQLRNRIYGSIDDFIMSSLRFNEMVEKYKMERFNSVFGLV